MAVARVSSDVETFLRFCLQNPQGVTEEELQRGGWTDKTQLLAIVNTLLGQQRLTLKKLAPGKLLYQATDPKFVGLDPQQMLVYQLIEKAGDKGTWSRILKDDSKLPQHVVTKITKDLMSRRLIKEVKSIHAKNKKVFMLWDTEASSEISGGTWYREGEFAAAWVDSLRQQCQQFLADNNGKVVTLQDVHNHVIMKPQQSVPSEDDIATVMRTLELDEDIYAINTGGGQRLYTQRNRGKDGQPFDIFAGRIPSIPSTVSGAADELPGLVVPCLSCHLQGECQPGGRVSPERCEYVAAWARGSAAADVRMNDW
mmetsp:Transcript_21853/g.62042  ORF Transcript_21853/g.62042 Transcript_21853/m.62042 type:complete len:312 (+) Transcript_21853:106-1041(+)